MSKILKIGGIIAAVAAVVYLFFIFFVSPAAANDPETQTVSYFDNITEDDVCEKHFNSETVSFCEVFKTNLEDKIFTYELVSSGSNIVATITIDDVSDDFTVSFIVEANTGISGFFHSSNYYIDTIE
ncbi:hypothetical protein KQ51_01439 [Candidatus Izimaplasma bacterium HR1]|jgi:hypothetical protein|uniref:hypothetical protein n=1 Tax=Candidatus Izimoplasma sp. HR1 TaxID=1541959 RepID=UPI0004F919D5|nr:hypothetical protein KQ51_01439 [Candidatus Izimaplasma bacterium HR1]